LPAGWLRGGAAPGDAAWDTRQDHWFCLPVEGLMGHGLSCGHGLRGGRRKDCCLTDVKRE